MNMTTATVTTATSLPEPNTTTPFAPILPSKEKCNYYIVSNSSSGFQWLDFGNPYGGIPQNLLINAVRCMYFNQNL